MKNFVKVLDLRPTQFAVGMLEVDEKIAIVKNYSKKELKAFIDESVVPVVRAPNGQLYVVDKHHYLSVCYHLGIESVRTEVVKDYLDKKMTYREFWNRMQKSRSTYLYCQFGNGPHREFYLPKDIRGVADDPYRSLAWFVRKAGAFKNSDKNFAEFQWASFFRSKKLLNREGMSGFEKALKKAVLLAQSPEAKNLPGYGKLNLENQEKAQKKAVQKVKKYRRRFKDHAVEADTE